MHFHRDVAISCVTNAQDWMVLQNCLTSGLATENTYKSYVSHIVQ